MIVKTEKNNHWWMILIERIIIKWIYKQLNDQRRNEFIDKVLNEKSLYSKICMYTYK